jgi:hypothetical protein
MSDHFLAIVPTDPMLVPAPIVQQQLADALRLLVPHADEIVCQSFDQPQFIDAGANFERVVCPRCSAEIDLDWWQSRMDEDWIEDGFTLASYELPCCGGQATLNELLYYLPQAFGRFKCTAMNPAIAELSSAQKADLEHVVGASLTVVNQHL